MHALSSFSSFLFPCFCYLSFGVLGILFEFGCLNWGVFEGSQHQNLRDTVMFPVEQAESQQAQGIEKVLTVLNRWWVKGFEPGWATVVSMSFVPAVWRSWGEAGAGEHVLHAFSVDLVFSVIDEVKIVFKGYLDCLYYVIAHNSSHETITGSENKTAWVWTLLIELLGMDIQVMDMDDMMEWSGLIWLRGLVQMSNVHILLDISDIHHLHCDDLKNSERHDDACLVIPSFTCVRCCGFKEHLNHQGLCFRHEFWEGGWSLIFACQAEASFEEIGKFGIILVCSFRGTNRGLDGKFTDEKLSKSYCSQDVCQVQHKPTQIYHECDKNSHYTGPMRIITILTPVYCTLNHFF